MRRRLTVRLLAIAGVGFAFFLLAKYLVSPHPDLSATNVARIEVGMTLKEVQAIVSAPPGKSYTRSDWVMVPIPPMSMGPFPPPANKWTEWLNNDGHLYVVFDASGLVCHTQHTAFPGRTFARRLQDTFPLPFCRGGAIYIR